MKHRPLRTFLSALLIAIPVTLVLTLAGLSKGMLEDATKRYRGVGADIVIRPRTSDYLSLGNEGIPERLLDVIRKQPHVAMATGMAIQPNGNMLNWATGIDLRAINQMSGGLIYVVGGPFRDPGDVIVDNYYAQEHKVHVGDMIDVLNKKWRVSGIIEPGKLNRVFVDLRRLQELTGNTGKINQIYVKVDDHANIGATVIDLKRLLEGYKIYSMEEFASLFKASGIPALQGFTNVVVGIAVFIGFAVVCLSMYMAVLQRTREIGILKSLGASWWYVADLILREAVMLAVVGTVLGIIMSFGAKWLLQTLVPASFQPAIDPTWWPIAAMIALLGAVLGALYPGLHAAKMDPIEALSYE